MENQINPQLIQEELFNRVSILTEQDIFTKAYVRQLEQKIISLEKQLAEKEEQPEEK